MDLSLPVSKENYDILLKDLIAVCAECSGSMRIRAIKLEVRGGSAFLRRRIIPHDLQEAVHRILNDLCEKHMAEPITSLAWSTPTFMPLKSYGKTLSICDDYKLTLNSRLLKKTCTMVKAEIF